MAWVLDQSCLMLHPFMPFITEELWGHRDRPLALSDWPAYGADLIDEGAEAEMTWVIRLIEDVRSLRAEMGVAPGQKLPLILTDLDAKGRAAYARNAPMIERLARLSGMSEGAAPKGAVTIPVEGGAFALPLAGVVDVAAEKARLSKALDKLEKEIAGLAGRLGNPKFIASAPEEIVDEARANLEAREAEAARIRAALARLADVA
jgi:valyl-tRNA synthetase